MRLECIFICLTGEKEGWGVCKGGGEGDKVRDLSSGRFKEREGS